MKSQIVEVGNKKVLGFPKLMQGFSSNVIVLFHKDRKGQVVNGGTGSITLGDYHNEFNMEFFEDFKGTIELSNE
jgi:hypothetical protein